MRNRLIEVLFVLLYGLHTTIAVNTRLVEQIIPYGNFYVYFYIPILLFLLLILYDEPLCVNTKDISFRTVGLLTLYISVFGIISAMKGVEGGLGDELLSFWKYIMVAAATIHFVKQFNLVSELLLASFVGGSGLLLYVFFLAGAPFDIFNELGTFFSNDYDLRYRIDFGFTNPNTVGNISACLLIVYCLFLSWIRNYEEKSIGRTLKIWICTAIAVIDSIVLLSSGSRNSMLTLIFFAIAILYFKITNSKLISEQQKPAFKFLIILFAGIIAFFGFFGSVSEMFETSGRGRCFEVNVRLVLNNGSFFEGLGIINPGLFGRDIQGEIVDNYYLYVFMETGFIGLVMITTLLMGMAKHLHSLRMSKDPFYLLLSSAFFAWLVSGIGETSVIYPQFASSLVFFIIFLSFQSIKQVESPQGVMNRKKSFLSCIKT